jgi:hypothetical protein
MSFFARLKMALGFLFGGSALPAATPVAALPASQPVAPAPVALTPQQVHASALFMLGLMQREGRLLDFLQEDIGQVADADLGAAARLVHDGCRKVLTQYLPLSPVMNEAEGAQVTLQTGFDANRFRLTGNVTGTGPWRGALKHHGWVVTAVQLPAVPSTVDVKVIAPAEIELPS